LNHGFENALASLIKPIEDLRESKERETIILAFEPWHFENALASLIKPIEDLGESKEREIIILAFEPWL
jgi:hypothetical protein